MRQTGYSNKAMAQRNRLYWPTWLTESQVLALETAGFTPVTALKATFDELVAVTGIGPASAQRLGKVNDGPTTDK